MGFHFIFSVFNQSLRRLKKRKRASSFTLLPINLGRRGVAATARFSDRVFPRYQA
jgi:hypothetical protein